MIITTITDFSLYAALHPLFNIVHKELLNRTLFPFGERMILDGERLYASPAQCTGRSAEEAKLEAHDKYIDVQVCLGGSEQIGWRDRRTCTQIHKPYDTSADIVFYNDAPTSFITLHSGQLAIFYPTDSHAPLIGNGAIEKVVFKVKLDV